MKALEAFAEAERQKKERDEKWDNWIAENPYPQGQGFIARLQHEHIFEKATGLEESFGVTRKIYYNRIAVLDNGKINFWPANVLAGVVTPIPATPEDLEADDWEVYGYTIS